MRGDFAQAFTISNLKILVIIKMIFLLISERIHKLKYMICGGVKNMSSLNLSKIYRNIKKIIINFKIWQLQFCQKLSKNFLIFISKKNYINFGKNREIIKNCIIFFQNIKYFNY